MADRYSVRMVCHLAGPSAVWAGVRITAKAICAVHENTGGWYGNAWSMHVDGRSWERDALDDLRKIAVELSLTTFVVRWHHTAEGIQWGIRAYVYEKYSSYFEAEAYAGVDRMTTERAAKAVADTVKRRHITLSVWQTSISSTDDGGPEGARMPTKPRSTDGSWECGGALSRECLSDQGK